MKKLQLLAQIKLPKHLMFTFLYFEILCNYQMMFLYNA